MSSYRATSLTQCSDTMESARNWVVHFYPDLEVFPVAEALLITSSTRDEVELELIWKTALLNEASIQRSALQRRQDLEALVK